MLILLLHYSKTDNEIVYFRSDANKQSKEHRVYNINLLKETLGDDVCNELLFVLAYSGCDSTSRIYGIGKKSAFRKLVKYDPVTKSCASAFILQNKSQEDISDLGKDLMVDIFGGYHHCAISFSSRKWQLLKHSSLLNGLPQHHLQQDSKVNVCIFTLWYGWGWQMK